MTEIESGQQVLEAAGDAMRAIVEPLEDVVCVVRIQGSDLRTARVQAVSRGCERLTGHPPEDFVNDPELWFRLLHPEDATSVFEATRRILESRTAGMREYRLLHAPTRVYRWLEDRVVPQFDSANRLIGFVGAARDVTDRRRAEQALRDSERRYHTLAAACPVGIFRTDAAGRCLYVNESWCRIAGLTPRDALGAGWATALHPEDASRVRDQWAAAVAAVQPFRSEYRFQRADGVVTWVLGQAVPELDASGACEGFVGTVTDLSERKQAEILARSRELQQAAVARLGQQALGEVELDPLLADATSLVATTLGVDSSLVMELRVPGDALVVRAEAGWPGIQDLAVPAAPSGSPSGLAVSTGASVVIEHLPSDARFQVPAFLRDHGVVSALVVSIPGFDRPFGTLGAYCRARHLFSADDLLFVEAVAQVLASGIMRRREAEQRALALERTLGAQEEERRRIARELHDGAGQALTSLLVGLRALEEMRSLREVKAAAPRLRDILAQTLDELDRLGQGLHPSALDDLGLPAAVGRLVADASSLHHLNIELVAEGLGAERASPRLEIAAYRMVQEALANALKHSGARRVLVMIQRRASGIELLVRDDGRGFEEQPAFGASSRGRGLGLLSLRERAALLAGTCVIRSAPGEGTSVVALLPWEARG